MWSFNHRSHIGKAKTGQPRVLWLLVQISTTQEIESKLDGLPKISMKFKKCHATKKKKHFNYRKKFRIEPRVSASFSLFLSGEKASKPPSPSWVTGILAPQGMIQNPSKYERWSMFWFEASYSVFFACFLVERFQFADLIRSHFRAWGHIFHGLVRYRNSKKKSPGILEHAYKSYILKNHQAYKTSLFKVYEHFKLGQVCAQVGQLTRDRLPRLKGCI